MNELFQTLVTALVAAGYTLQNVSRADARGLVMGFAAEGGGSCTIVLSDPAGAVSVSARLLGLVGAVDAAAAAVAVAGRVRDATE
ncbi:MAG TPA: hypothetical protein VM487_02160 [Phycisphaerae bacterium]|nr:hypothetical protein [Phycisphaerae bacterium]